MRQLLSFFLLVVMVFSSGLSLSTPAQSYPFFDDYENLSWKDEMSRLDNFSIYLRRNPELLGYIVFYVGKKGSYERVRKRIERGVKYLVEYRKFDKDRL